MFTSKNAGLQLEIANSDTLNKIVATPNNIPPAWATHFKYYIKEPSSEYYNIAADRIKIPIFPHTKKKESYAFGIFLTFIFIKRLSKISEQQFQ